MRDLPIDCQFIEMMCDGEFLQKDLDKAIEYLNDLVEKAHIWTGPTSVESTNQSGSNASTLSSGGIYQLKEEDSLKVQIVSSTREIDALKVKGVVGNKQVYQSEIHEECKICNDIGHPTKDCTILPSMMGMYEEHCGAISNYNRPYSPFSKTYNPTRRNHPNFSWKNETHSSSQSQMPQRNFFQSLPTPHASHSHPSNSLENTILAFIEAQSKTNQKC